MSFTPNREELAWAAGFFDGEGSFVILKRNYSVRLAIAQIHKDMLERFQNAIGGLGTIADKGYMSKLSKHKIYTLQISNFEHVQAAMAMLWTFLGPYKREQYKAILAKAKENPFWGSARSLRARKSWQGRQKKLLATTQGEV